MNWFMQECNEMTNIMQMNGIMEKLTILSDAAKYDVACTSSGVHRGGDGKNIGNAFASGIYRRWQMHFLTEDPFYQ